MLRPALLALALAAGTNARAATFAVDSGDDGVDAAPGDGACATAGGRCTLRAAIQESNALAGEDTIVLGAGTFVLSLPGSDEDASASGDLDVSDDLVLIGAGADATIVDAGALDRVLDLVAATSPRSVRIERLTLRNGLLDRDSQPAFTPQGAGLRIGAGVVAELRDVDVRDNRLTTFGSAAGIDNAGCLHGVRVRIIGNGGFTSPDDIFGYAGGLLTTGADSCLVLEDSEIGGNEGSLGGALIVDEEAPMTLRRVLVTGNVGVATGALHLNHGSNVLLENVTLSGNVGNPGAILNDGFTRLTIVNSTITGNRGAPHGLPNVGGIQDVHGGLGLVFVANTIVAGNGPALIPDCNHLQSLGGNLVGDVADCTADWRADDQPGADAGLGPLADHGGFTRTHLPGANAIDRGIDAACPAEDQRGSARPRDGDGDGKARCDVGAVEVDDVDALFSDGFDAPPR